MRSFIERSAEFLGVFSPIIILLFACSAYLYTPTHENDEINTETRQETVKPKTVTQFFLAHKN